jgi:protein tyrosine/serine phosphatase
MFLRHLTILSILLLLSPCPPLTTAFLPSPPIVDLSSSFLVSSRWVHPLSCIPPTAASPGDVSSPGGASSPKLCEFHIYDGIKNARDLSSVPGSPITPNILLRTGMPSNASPNDIDYLKNTLKIKTLVDLRSLTELKGDEGLKSQVYEGYVDMKWSAHKRLQTVSYPVEKIDDASVPRERRERHFVSLMDEKKYVLGTFQRLQKRALAQLAITAPGAVVSRRARYKSKKIFLDTINSGGLPLLNSLILQMASSGIAYVLRVIADESRHPVAFYCTAGKDRTGIISAIILSFLGVDDTEIVKDYALSAAVYSEMENKEAMVGALKQRDLNPDVFLDAPAEVMMQTLKDIADDYGGIEGYLDYIGFSEEDRNKLRNALVVKNYKVTKLS